MNVDELISKLQDVILKNLNNKNVEITKLLNELLETL